MSGDARSGHEASGAPDSRGLVGIDGDGNPVEFGGRAALVSRRQPDGTWRIVLDDPLSPE